MISPRLLLLLLVYSVFFDGCNWLRTIIYDIFFILGTISVRDFPDEYGNKNEFVAATMIIVLFSIIFMGACCEPLLRFLGIQMGVDNQEYMREWRKRRQLTGRFHSFGKLKSAGNHLLFSIYLFSWLLIFVFMCCAL